MRRPRWSLRMMLLSIAIIAAGIAVEQLSRAASARASALELRPVDSRPSNGEASRILAQVHQHDALADRYRRAAWRPWTIVRP